MTLTSTTVRSTHTGDGTTVTFSYGFKIFSETEVAVYVAGVLKTITTHYTVSGVGSSTGGNITFETSAKPASSESIVFVRVPARTQTTDYTITGTIDPQTVEDALDKTTMLIQDIGDSSDTAFGFTNTVTDAGTTKISSNASDRGSKLLAFDSSGNLVADQEIGTFQGNWAASTAYVVRDIIKDTNNNNIYICKTAHTSSGSVPISTNTDVAKWDLLVDAASASTSATAAASSATAAASSATAAASSATSSASSATSSASSATSSASSATSSASSATSSASSSTTSGNYSNKVDGAITGTEFSSKAWAIGGTGVTDTASRGAAKEWATAAEDDLVDGSEYSAKHYSLKAQTHATNAAANSGPYYSATTGTNTYVATPTPALTSYAEGVDIILKFGAGNTGSTTLNVSGLGAKGLKKADGSEFSSGELTSSQIQHFVYNGTEFRLLGTVAATEDLIKINTLDIFQNTINDMADHSDNLLETVDGFTDNFQDGSTQNNTAFDLTGSSGVTHDNTNKLWGNTDGATGANDDKPYTTESNYIQQEWDQVIVGANAVFTNGSATVTTSGTFPTNCANGRISQDGTNWYDITTRDSATQLTLSSNFAQSTVTGTFDIRMTEFDSGVVKLSSVTVSGTEAIDRNYDTATPNHSYTLGTTGQPSLAMCFSAGATGLLSKVECRMMQSNGTAPGTFTVSLYPLVGGVNTVPDDSGTALATITGLDRTGISTDGDPVNGTFKTFTFSSPATVTSGSFYAVVVTQDTPNDSNYFRITSYGGETHSSDYAYYQSGAWTADSSSYQLQYETYITPQTITSVASEYVSVADSYSQSSDVSAWLDINSSAVTETLNSQNAYYWYSFDPSSSYGAGTEIVVPKPAIAAVYDGIDSATAYISHFDGSDASTTITDSSANNILMTVSGSKTSLNTSTKKIGTASFRQESGAVAGSDWALSSASSEFNLSTTDWTIEAWVYVSSTSSTMLAIGENVSLNNNNLHFQFEHGAGSGSSSSSVYVYEYGTGTASNPYHVTMTGPTWSQWQHYAWVRQGTVLKSYLDGTLSTTHTCNADYGWTGNTYLKLGNRLGPSGGKAWAKTTGDVFMDELRISRTARYTGNFTPRTTAFTDSLTTPSVASYIRPIAKNDSGTWKYNSNSSANNTFTAATSTVNDMLHATSQAISSEAENRLTSSEISSLADADFELTNGFTTSDSKLTRGLTLYSGSSSQNPEVSLFRVNYDSDKADGTFLTRAFGGTNMPPVPSGNIDTMVALIIDKRTTGTPTYEASSNGGTTWTEFSTWVHEDLMSNGYTKRMAEIDVSAHTGARTSPLIRIKNGSIGEDYDLKAIGIKYK
jgi:hypothetical protein